MIKRLPVKERVAAIRARMSPKFSEALEAELPNMEWEGQILAKLIERPELIGDPIWRIGNLYWCAAKTRTTGAQIVNFIPKPAQCLLLYDIFIKGINRHVVLKARQIGFSTLICTIGLDHVVFNKDTQFNVVSLDESKAQDLLIGKIKFAFDLLPAVMKERCKTGKKMPDNRGEFMFDKVWGIRSKVNFRSGTSHVLLVSEWGITAVEDKKKSKEIKNGTLETAGVDALVFLESTAKGGEQGDYWDIWEQATLTEEEDMNELSWNPFFTPWFQEEAYRLIPPNGNAIREATKLYFEDLRKYWLDKGWTEEEVDFDDEQMYYWQVKSDQKGADMYQEYPSTPEEAFKVPVDGEVYAKALHNLSRNGQICDFRYNQSLPVFAAIDYGQRDATAIWVFQVDATRVDLLWYHEECHKDEQYFVNKVTSAGFTPIRWALPWDCWQYSEGDNLNPHCPAARFIRAGAIGCFQIPRGRVRKRVECGRALLPRCRFMEHSTKVGRMSMESYSWPSDREKPVHNEFSHGADAFGYMAEAESLGYFKTSNSYNRMAHERVRKQKKTFKSTTYQYGNC